MTLINFALVNIDIIFLLVFPCILAYYFARYKLVLNKWLRLGLTLILVLFTPNILYLLDKIFVFYKQDGPIIMNFHTLLNPSDRPDLPIFADGYARESLSFNLEFVLKNIQIQLTPETYGLNYFDTFIIILLVIICFGYCTNILLQEFKINLALKYLCYFALTGIAMYLGNLARLNSWDVIFQPTILVSSFQFIFYPYIFIYIVFWSILSFIIFLLFKILNLIFKKLINTKHLQQLGVKK